MMRTLLTVFFSVAVAAQANSITINFDSSSLKGNPGTELFVTGTLTNDTGSTLFINSDSFTFAISGALLPSPFMSDAPSSLSADATSSDIVLFEIVIPALQPAGPYVGAFTVVGGASNSASDNEGSNPFTATVYAPEPSSFLLCGAGIAMLMRRRLSKLDARS
jgi:hypothetical protein